MKNLKKVLALVMAFAMAFTMMAGAAYTDQADIVATEAVDTLAALNVMTGNPDGSFAPNKTVTRAEMCRMIYTIRSGGNDDASSYAGMKTTFTDVADSAWYAGYVKYCQSVGIVSGRSKTIFDPNSDVSGVEAALMCLRVMGYDPAKAGIGGSTWSTTTIGLATENGLLDDVNCPITTGLPRQYAAQIMYNMIDAHTVRWSTDSESYNNYAEATGDKYETVGKKYMKLNTAEGVLEAVEKEDGKSTYMMDLTNVTKKNGNLPTKSDKDDNEYFADIHFSKVAKDYTALKNQKVKVLYKGTDEVFGVYALSEDNTALASVLGNFEKDTDTRIKFDGSKYNVKKDAEVKLDTEVQKNVTVANYVDEDGKYNKGLAKAFDAKAVSNDGTGKINLLDVESFSVAQVTYVGKDYINVTTVAGAKVDTKLSNDDANYPEGLEKDDYVMVSPEKVSVDTNKHDVAKLDLVKGKVSSTKNTAGNDDYTLKIDGTWYEAALNKAADLKEAEAGDTVAVVVKDGFIVAIDDLNATADDVALLIELGKTSGVGAGYEADLLFADGKREVVKVDDDKDSKDKFESNILENGTVEGILNNKDNKPILVSYDKDGSKYEIDLIKDEDGARAGYDKFAAVTTVDNTVDNNRLTKGDIKYIDDNATVLVRYDDGDKFTTTTGKDLKTWKDTKVFESAVLGNKDGGTIYAKLIYVNLDKSTSVPGGADTLFAYLFDGPEFVDAENDYREYEAWNGTEDVTVKILDSDDKAGKDQQPEGSVIEYTLDADGFASVDNIWTPDEFTAGAIIGGELADDLTGSVEFAGNKVFDIDEDDDPIVLFVDMDGDAGSVMTDWRTAIEEKPGVWTNNAAYVVDGANNKHLKVIVVDAGDNDLSVSGIYEKAVASHKISLDKSYKSFELMNSSAKKGESVTLQLKLNQDATKEMTVTATVNGESVTFTVEANAKTGDVVDANKAFTMPDKDVSVHLEWK